ncbi:MAG: efflux RND transporter periplasmic adaptor subunit [Pseudomonadota bacterium]
MKPFSAILAIVVIGALYLIVFERDRVMQFSGADPANAVEASAAAPDANAAAEQAVSMSVVALRSNARTIDSAVVLRGETQAARRVDVRAETSGLIVSEPLRKGALVEAGQLLCEIDPGSRLVALDEAEARLAEAEARIPEAQAGIPAAEAALAEAEARLLEARARLQEAEINSRAARRLIEGGFASETRVAATDAALEAARAGVVSADSGVKSASSGIAGAVSSLEGARAGRQSAQASVAAAETELERLTLTAPFSGRLESDTAELGSLLQPGGLCATVIQIDPVKLVGFVPEMEVDRITLGAPAAARLVSGREISGTVSFVARSSDPATRTFRTEITVPNRDASVRDGQTVEIAVAAAGTTAHLLPPSALTLDNEGALGVRLVEDGVARFRAVKVLRDTVEGIWLAGIPDEADVIVVGQEFVTDGVPVKVTYRDTTQ